MFPWHETVSRSHRIITDRTTTMIMMMTMMIMTMTMTMKTILLPFNLYIFMKLHTSDNTSLVENELLYSKSTSWIYYLAKFYLLL